TVLIKTLGNDEIFNSRYTNKPTINATKQAIAADSVAVNAPLKIPTIIIIGTARAGNTFTNDKSISLMEALFSFGHFSFIPINAMIIIKESPNKIPGITPA